MKTLLKKISRVLVIVIICMPVLSSKAQFFTGGDMNIGILGGLNLNIAPIAGYRYKNFSVGVSPIIQYQATSTVGMSGQFSYGGSVFMEYSVWKGIFGHAEFHVTNSGYLKNSLGDIYKKGVWVMGAPIGVGYEHQLSGNLWVKTMLLYDPFLDI
ncbi:MAG TPA: hypothetical protein PLL90_11110, partial [Bacteroidales bacterium]|nr:hypothetical protein [Bacteroidales bacterium]